MRKIVENKQVSTQIERFFEGFNKLVLVQEDKLKEMLKKSGVFVEDEKQEHHKDQQIKILNRVIENKDGKIKIVKNFTNGKSTVQYQRKMKDNLTNILPDTIARKDQLLLETTKNNHLKGTVQSLFHSNKEFYVHLKLDSGKVKRIKMGDVKSVKKF